MSSPSTTSGCRRSLKLRMQRKEKQDLSILRGAEIIRQQLRKQLEEEDAFCKNAADVRDNLLGYATSIAGSSCGADGANHSNVSGQSGQTESSLEDDDDDNDDEAGNGVGDPGKNAVCKSTNKNNINNTISLGRKDSEDSSTVFRELPSSLTFWEDVDCSSIHYKASPDKSLNATATQANHSSTSVTPPVSPSSPPAKPPKQRSTNINSRNNDNDARYPAATLNRVKEMENRDGNCYSFVGDDYDSDLDQDDHFNSSNINSYLPGHLRKQNNNNKNGKSWSPSVLSLSSSSHHGMKPMRLDSSEFLNSSASTTMSSPPSIHKNKTLRSAPKAVTATQSCSMSLPNHNENDLRNNNNLTKKQKILQQQPQQQQPSTQQKPLSPRSSRQQQQEQQRKQQQPTAKSSTSSIWSIWHHPKQPSKPQQQRQQEQPRQQQQYHQPLSSANMISRTCSERTHRDLTAALVGYHTASCQAPSTVSDIVVSPLSVEYDMLQHDPAFCHAQKAGLVWQSLVGQQVRFPSRWWNGARGPPMGILTDNNNDAAAHFVAPWEYLVAGNCHVAHCRPLNRLVRNRAAPGRLALHAIVLHQGQAVADVVVGVVHPNARGIRTTCEANPDWDSVRCLWMAVRKRSRSCNVLDSFAKSTTPFAAVSDADDAGSSNSECNKIARRKINNHNMRAVYGELPPVETLFVPQWELEQRMANQSPAMALLQQFVFE